MISIDPRAPLREHHGEPVSPEVAEASKSKSVNRQLSVHFYPQRTCTIWTVTTVDRQGHRTWHRRIGHGALPLTYDELHGRELADVLRLLLRGAVENLS